MTTTVINLKGRIHDYGPRLEHAPDAIYIGWEQTQGGWKLRRNMLFNPHRPNGKPCRVPECGGAVHDREESVSLYCRRLLDAPELLALVPPLRGLTLGCWCAPKLCHGHVLAVLAGVPEGRMEMHLQGMADYPVIALHEYAAS